MWGMSETPGDPDKMKMPPVSEANDSDSGELEWDREHSRHTGKE